VPKPVTQPAPKPSERAADDVLEVEAPAVATAKAVTRGLAVQAAAPGAGRLSVALRSGGTTLATGARTTAKAASLTVALRATKAGRRALKRLTGKRLTLVVTFAPRGGGPKVTTVQRLTLA
jgi:hypothetical protein